MRASEVVHSFLHALNSRDWLQVRDLLSRDCILDNLARSTAVSSRENVTSAFKAVLEATAGSTKMVVDGMNESSSMNVGLTWHVELAGNEVPGSRGMSFYKVALCTTRLVT